MNTVQEIMKGRTLLRSYMNQEVTRHTLSGEVIDIGGGIDPLYHTLFQKKEPLTITSLDLKQSATTRSIDLEKDHLPFKDASMDGVLMFNILEHIFNYHFVLTEAYRILKPHAQILGFVPFLINYHPDPHDYFRYTHEALDKMLANAGFHSIEIKGLGGGPFSVNYNTIVLSIPVIFRVVLYPVYMVADKIFLMLRPQAKKRYPLGYFFIARR